MSHEGPGPGLARPARKQYSALMFGPLTKSVALAASPTGRKAIRRAVELARSEEGRKMIAQARKMTEDVGRRPATVAEARGLLGIA